MEQKIKTIHLCHYSHSLISKNFEEDIYYRDWNVRVAKQIKKYYPKIDVEVWNIETKYNKEIKKSIKGILFRIFPSSFRIRYGKEISFYLLKALKKEIKKCKKENIKLIIHIHEPHNWQGIIIPLLFKNEIIFGQHHGGRAPLKHLVRKIKYYPLVPFLLFEQFFENLSLKNFNIIYYLTEKERTYLEKKIDIKKLKFQTMGVDFNKFGLLNKKEVRKKLGLKSKEKIMIFVGSVIERKGLFYLIRAMRKISQIIPEIKLLIIGETDREPKYYKKLLKEINKNNLDRYIKFLGRIDNSQIPLYLNCADIYIQPSFSEGAPVSIIESLACDLPFISTDVGSINELSKNNRGILIKPGDEKGILKSILYFFSNKEKFQNIRKKSKQFNWKYIIKETVLDYKKNYKRIGLC